MMLLKIKVFFITINFFIHAAAFLDGLRLFDYAFVFKFLKNPQNTP